MSIANDQCLLELKEKRVGVAVSPRVAALMHHLSEGRLLRPDACDNWTTQGSWVGHMERGKFQVKALATSADNARALVDAIEMGGLL